MVVAEWGSISTRRTSVGEPRMTADTCRQAGGFGGGGQDSRDWRGGRLFLLPCNNLLNVPNPPLPLWPSWRWSP